MGNAITRLDNANAVAFSPIKLQQGMSQVRQHLKRAMTAGDMEVAPPATCTLKISTATTTQVVQD